MKAKRVLSILLTVCMVMSVVTMESVTAVAASGGIVRLIDTDGNHNDSYTSVQDAINDASDGYTVQLLGDVTESIIIASDDSITLDLNGFTLTGSSGDVITVNGGIIEIKNGTISGDGENTDSGICVQGTSSVTVTNCIITDNTATGNGGGIYAYATDAMVNITITKSTISGNTATDNGGGIYAYAIDAMVNITITKSTISGNTATNGGGIYADSMDATVNITITESAISGNTAASGGGIYANGTGNSAISDTTITNSTINGNSAQNGGGIYLNSSYSSLLMNGCYVTGNTATGNGGGIYSIKSTCALLDTEITDNTASQGGGVYYNSKCFAAGTKISMADGTEKAIEDIAEGDIVKTFDHESGAVSSAEVYLAYKGGSQDIPFTLTFDNGMSLSITGCHDLLEKDALKYVTLTDASARDYIGKYFYSEDGWHKLESVSNETTPCDYYSIYTAGHQNCYANGFLSVPDDVDYLLNIYELDESLRADETQLQADIDIYGFFTYEYAHNTYGVTEDWYNYSNIKYINVAIGKGLITLEYLEDLYATTDDATNEEDNDSSNQPSSVAPMLTAASPMLLTSVNKTPTIDEIKECGKYLIIGDGTKIINNTGESGAVSNAYIETEDVSSGNIKIYGTLSDVNVGVTSSIAPTEGSPAVFTTNDASGADLQYFFSDSDDYIVKYDDEDGNSCLVIDDGPGQCYIDSDGDSVLDLAETAYATISAALAVDAPDDESESNPTIIRMIGDITENITIAGGRFITLDLNGCVLKGDGTDHVIINQGTLTIVDSDPDSIHHFSDSDTYTGLWVWDETETATTHIVNGGIITGGVSSNGGGIYNSCATLTMNGGNIVGNLAKINVGVAYGGGVYNHAQDSSGKDAIFTMNNGNIMGNATMCNSTMNGSGSYGAGVCNNGQLKTGSCAIFTMTGGSISNNTANSKNKNCNGGGIYNSQFYNFTMIGGTVSDNKAKTNGGGVFILNTTDSTATIGGSAVITGNTKLDGTTASNLYLSSTTINISTETPFVSGANIGVTTSTAPTEVIPVAFTSNGDASDIQYFFSDKADYTVAYNDDGSYLELVCTSEVSADISGAKYFASLTLCEDIDVNFSIKELGDDFNDTLIKIFVDGTAINSDDITYVADEHILSCVLKEVTPDKMSESMHVVITYDDILVKAFDYSVLRYCKAMFASYDSTSPLYALCEALLNYGKYAEDYSKEYYNTGEAASTINAGHEADFGDEYEFTDLGTVVIKGSAGSASLTLGSTIKLNFIVETETALSAGTGQNFRILDGNNKSVSLKNLTVTDNGSGRYTISADMYASQLSASYTLKLDGVDTNDFCITYGVYNYCSGAQDMESAAYTATLKTLCKAIHNYGQAVQTYIESQAQ